MGAPPTKLRDRARLLRATQTDAERKLWGVLRNRKVGGAKFRRQQPIGPFIADFCCWEYRLVIEVDGGHHAEQIEQDAARTAFLETRGLRVIRFWNNEVLQDLDAVLDVIHQAILKA